MHRLSQPEKLSGLHSLNEKHTSLTLLIGSSVRLFLCSSGAFPAGEALRPTWPYRKAAPTYSVNRLIGSSVHLFMTFFRAV